MTSAEPVESPRPRRRPSWLRRLYADLSPAGVFAALGVALVFSLGRSANGVLTSIRDGEFIAWLGGMGSEFAGHALMVLVLIAVIAPVMSVGPPAGWRRAVALLVALAVGATGAALIRIVQVDLTMTPTGAALAWPQLLDRFFVRFFVRYGYIALLFVVAAEFYR